MLDLAWRKVRSAAGTATPPGSAEVQGAICTFIMESSMVYWIPPDTVDETKGEALCNVPSIVHIVDGDGVDSDDLVVALNFHERRLASPPTYRGEELHPRDCLALLLTAFAGHSRPQVHSHANRGADTRADHAFTRRMAVVTRFYNHMGFESYPATMSRFESMGLATATTERNTRYVCHPNHNLPPTYNGGVAAGLEPHSGYVRFVNEAGRLIDAGDAGPRGLSTYLTCVIHAIDHNHIRTRISLSPATRPSPWTTTGQGTCSRVRQPPGPLPRRGPGAVWKAWRPCSGD